jgi:hypothetical protein
VISQWVWNLRLELGHQLEPTALRTTEFAPAVSEALQTHSPSAGYGKPAAATSWKAGRFSGAAFPFQPDGTLRCPADKVLSPTEQRREDDGSLRVLYAARIGDCRVYSLREQCQWHGRETTKPRRVSLLLHPLSVGAAPVRLRVIGVAERTGAPACSSCATNEWTSSSALLSRTGQTHCLRSFPGRSGPMFASRGTSGSHAMHELQALAR